MAKNAWKRADQISDKIIELANAERLRKDFAPLQLFAGLMLGITGVMRSVAGAGPPKEFIAVHDAIGKCLHSMMAEETEVAQ